IAAGHQSIHRQPEAVAAPPRPADAVADVDTVTAGAERPRQVEEQRGQAEEEQRRRDEAQRAEAERRDPLAGGARRPPSVLPSLVHRKAGHPLLPVLRPLPRENPQAWLPAAEPEDPEELATLIDAHLPEQKDDVTDEDHWDGVVTSPRAALSTRRTPDAIAS